MKREWLDRSVIQTRQAIWRSSRTSAPQSCNRRSGSKRITVSAAAAHLAEGAPAATATAKGVVGTIASAIAARKGWR